MSEFIQVEMKNGQCIEVEKGTTLQEIAHQVRDTCT